MPSYVELPIIAVVESKPKTTSYEIIPSTLWENIYVPTEQFKAFFWPFRRKKNSRLSSTPSPKSMRPSLSPHHTRRACCLVGEDRSLGIISRVSCITNVAHQATQLLSVGDDQPTVRLLVRTDPSQIL